jgi:hypothetical protein
MNQGKWEADTLMSTVSPRNNCNFSMVSILSATTELSSFTASSTIRRFGAFFRSKIAVEKSLFAAAGFLLRPERQLKQKQPVKLWPDNKHSSDNNILLPTDEHADKIETKTQHSKFPQKIHCQTTLGNMKHRKANKSKSKRTLPSSLPFITHIKTLRIPLQKAGKSGKKKKKKKDDIIIF